LKISVIIPTHNRLENLTSVIGTIINQDYEDWEIIVSDNHSEEDIKSYISTLNEPRIHYYRTDSFVAVTDNWNNVINRATGDYIIMLGDDDGLLPGYFSKISETVEKFDSPPVIYSAMYQFANPGAIPGETQGYLAEVRNGFFFEGKDEPFVLDKKDAHKAARGSLQFQRQFSFNIQCFTLRKDFVELIKGEGEFYQSPYPDYYIANVIFLIADRIIIDPRPIALAGITKKSFGFFLINGITDKGAELLNNASILSAVSVTLKQKLLTGSEYQSNYLLAMCQVVANYGEDFKLSVNFGRYRRLQIFHVLERYIGVNPFKDSAFMDIWKNLTLTEKSFALLLISIFTVGSVFSARIREKVRSLTYKLVTPYKHKAMVNFVDRGSYNNALDVYNAFVK